jgi:hypothetical protein
VGTSSQQNIAPGFLGPAVAAASRIVNQNFKTYCKVAAALEPIIQFQVPQRAIFALRVDRFHCRQSLGITRLRRSGDVGTDAVFETGVVEVCQRFGASGGAAGIAEGPRLEDAAAGIPQVAGIGEGQRVEFA